MKDKKTVAIKKIRIFDKKQGLPKSFFREVSQMKKLNLCENSCKLLNVIKDSNGIIYLILEYCDFDLERLINLTANNGLPVNIVKCYFKQIVNGLIECKKHQILHRDLKPSNVLITRDNIVKIADYGLSRDFSRGKNNLTLNIATPGYKAPEIILGDKNYSYSSDIWSLGVILFKMITGLQLFEPKNSTDIQQLLSIVNILGKPTSEDFHFNSQNIQILDFMPEKESKLDDILEDIFTGDFEDAKELIKGMLCYNPEQRISLEDILHSSFLQNYNEDNLFNPLKLPLINYANESIKTTYSNYSSAEISISSIPRPPRVEINPYF